MSDGNFDDVCAFHARFGIPAPERPEMLLKDVHDFRVDFMLEELEEYRTAETLEDKIDALVDLVYVALGTARLHGFRWELHWREVQRANMTKERVPSAAASKRGHAFDVRKPPGWCGPDHARVFREEY
jgi:predicted HAD superfamily Cof-like phosphohydrolase